MRVTLQAINKRLAAKGYRARVEKGEGYFYVFGGEASDWLDRIIQVPTLSSLTLDQWVEKFEKLKKLNQEIMKTPAKTRGAKERS
jgi:hypothetical protein